MNQAIVQGGTIQLLSLAHRFIWQTDNDRYVKIDQYIVHKLPKAFASK